MRTTTSSLLNATAIERVMDNESTEHEPLLRESRATPPRSPRQDEDEVGPRLGPRPLLLHEPPILCYDGFEGYDRAQKWLKETAEGEADLPWKSEFLGYQIEKELLEEYMAWIIEAAQPLVSCTQDVTVMSDGSLIVEGDSERLRFYSGLLGAVNFEAGALADENTESRNSRGMEAYQ